MNPTDLDPVEGADVNEPEEAKKADTAEAGDVATAKGSSANPESEGTDTATVPGMTPAGGGGSEEEEVHEVWVKLEDDQGNPVKKEKFTIRFSDGSERSGTTDDEGVGGFERVPAGSCEVNFPRIHRTEWQ